MLEEVYVFSNKRFERMIFRCAYMLTRVVDCWGYLLVASIILFKRVASAFIKIDSLVSAKITVHNYGQGEVASRKQTPSRITNDLAAAAGCD